MHALRTLFLNRSTISPFETRHSLTLTKSRQITSVLDDIHVSAIKTGMLSNAEIVTAIVSALKAHYTDPAKLPPIVCDPVCVSTSGHTLLHQDALHAVTTELFPISKLITPNKSEAALLVSHLRQSKSTPNTSPSNDIITLDDMIKAAEELLEYGSEWVLVKGGHISLTLRQVTETTGGYSGARLVKQGIYGENMEILLAGQIRSGQGAATTNGQPEGEFVVVDVLRSRAGTMALFVRPRVESRSTHGTGCTLSSAIAAGIANGLNGTSAGRQIETIDPSASGRSGGKSDGIHLPWDQCCPSHRPRVRASEPLPQHEPDIGSFVSQSVSQCRRLLTFTHQSDFSKSVSNDQDVHRGMRR